MSNGKPTTVVLVRSAIADYQALVNTLNEQSKNILADKAAAEAREKAAQKEREFIASVNFDYGVRLRRATTETTESTGGSMAHLAAVFGF